MPGPWDQQRLPLSRVRGRGDWQDGVARLGELAVHVADTAGRAQGQIVGKGSFSSGAASWDTVLALQGINPAALHGKLAAARLNGDIKA